MVITEIKNLGASKASQEDDILTKIVKENSYFQTHKTYFPILHIRASRT